MFAPCSACCGTYMSNSYLAGFWQLQKHFEAPFLCTLLCMCCKLNAPGRHIAGQRRANSMRCLTACIGVACCPTVWQQGQRVQRAGGSEPPQHHPYLGLSWVASFALGWGLSAALPVARTSRTFRFCVFWHSTRTYATTASSRLRCCCCCCLYLLSWLSLAMRRIVPHILPK